MTANEAKDSLKKLARLFPGSISGEQAKSAHRDFLRLSFEAVDRAIESANATTRPNDRGFRAIDWPRLFRDARAAQAQASPAIASETWPQVQRRLHSWLGECSDEETVLRIFRQQAVEAWGRLFKSSPNARFPEGMSDSYRRSFAVKTREQLIALYFRDVQDGDDVTDLLAQAEQRADLIYATPEIFRESLYLIRGDREPVEVFA